MAQLRIQAPAFDHLLAAVSAVHREAWATQLGDSDASFYYSSVQKAVDLMQRGLSDSVLAVCAHMLVMGELIRTADSGQAATHFEAFARVLQDWQDTLHELPLVQRAQRQSVINAYLPIFQAGAEHYRSIFKATALVGVAGRPQMGPSSAVSLLQHPRFDSLRQAVDALEDLFVSWTSRMLHFRPDSWVESLDFRRVLELIKAWSVSFQSLKVRLEANGPVSPGDLRIMRALEMQCHFWQTVFSWCDPLTFFPISIEEQMMTSIVVDCEYLMIGVSPQAIQEIPVSALAPVGFVALYCRVRHLRQRALDLLKNMDVCEGLQSSRSFYLAGVALDQVCNREWQKVESGQESVEDFPSIRPTQMAFFLAPDGRSGELVVQYQTIFKRNIFEGSACIGVTEKDDVSACLAHSMAWPIDAEFGDSLMRLQHTRRKRAREAGDVKGINPSGHVPSLYTSYRYPIAVTQPPSSPSPTCPAVSPHPPPPPSTTATTTPAFRTGSRTRLATAARLAQRLQSPPSGSAPPPRGAPRAPDSVWFPLVSMCRTAMLQNPALEKRYARVWAERAGALPAYPVELRELAIGPRAIGVA